MVRFRTGKTKKYNYTDGLAVVRRGGAFAVLAVLVVATFPLSQGERVGADLTSCTGAGFVGGSIFNDYDADGTHDAEEPKYVPVDFTNDRITVTAYDDTGASASAQTDTDGDFVINIGALTAATGGNGDFRIEMTTLPTWIKAGPSGTNSTTDVTFANDGDCALSIGVNVPTDYCHTSPYFTANCYVTGDHEVGAYRDMDVLASFNQSDGDTSGTGTALAPWTTAAPVDVAFSHQLGSTWGLAWDRTRNKIYTATFLKQFVDFGGGGIGAIYEVDMDPVTGAPLVTPATGAADVPVFIDVAATEDVCNTLARPDVVGYTNDDTVFGSVGKCSLGDLEIDDSDTFLYTINLNTREVLQIDIATQAITNRWPVPLDQNTDANATNDCNDPTTDIRPFGLGFHQEDLYVGAVCSGESLPGDLVTQTARDDLEAYVWRVDTGTGAYTEVFNLDISENHPTRQKQHWDPWKSTYTDQAVYNRTGTSVLTTYSPILSDIEFYENDMTIGLRDRVGDQWGHQVPIPGGGGTLQNHDAKGGDLICASWNTTTFTYDLETPSGVSNRADCGASRSSTADGLDQGFGVYGDTATTEFYWGDGGNSVNGAGHNEASWGGLAQIPGQNLAITALNPSEPLGTTITASGGVTQINNVNGAAERAYILYRGSSPVGLFAKAGGIGDVVGLCQAAPVEIGNRVWNDADNDGVQDPGEAGIGSATVNIYLTGSTTVVSSKTTNTDGSFIFTEADGLIKGNTYVMRLDNAADYTTGQPLDGYAVTAQNTGTNDLHDNDSANGTAAGTGTFPEIAVSTLVAGNNNHTMDFGVFASTPSLGNLVWEDSNNNGVVDGGESGISGVRVDLYLDDGGMAGMYDGTNTFVTTTNTDTNGNYLFDTLTDNDYVVVIPATNFATSAALDGYTSSTGSYAGDGTYEGTATPDPDTDINDDDNGTLKAGAIAASAVTLTDGTEPVNDGDASASSNLSIDFGFFIPAALGDYVWYDANLDGVQDSGEAPVSGVTAELFIDADADGVSEPDGDDGAKVATLVTDNAGFYQFDKLPPGSYFVRFVDLPSGFFLTNNDTTAEAADSDANPTTGVTPVYTIVAGQTLGTVDGGIQNSTSLASTGHALLYSFGAGAALIVLGSTRSRTLRFAPKRQTTSSN